VELFDPASPPFDPESPPFDPESPPFDPSPEPELGPDDEDEPPSPSFFPLEADLEPERLSVA
jgi:hypothetical protein